jgi:hypothetical protein
MSWSIRTEGVCWAPGLGAPAGGQSSGWQLGHRASGECSAIPSSVMAGSGVIVQSNDGVHKLGHGPVEFLEGPHDAGHCI